MAHTLVIAEPGCTHEGDHGTLIRLLETAAACLASCFKPQWVSDPVQMCERRHIGPDHPKRAYYERAYRWNSFPVDWHQDFRDRCHALGMQYACTAFLAQDVATLAPFVDYFKIASFEASDWQLLSARPINTKALISLGMMTEEEYQALVLRIHDAEFLHCVSAYPAPLSAMNLRAIRGGAYGTEGISDHSRHLLTGAIAVACGAEIVETHYRLDDCDPKNPDYAVAFTPAEFAQYIRNIRDAEVMLGSGEKRVQDCERDMLPYRVGS